MIVVFVSSKVALQRVHLVAVKLNRTVMDMLRTDIIQVTQLPVVATDTQEDLKDLVGLRMVVQLLPLVLHLLPEQRIE